MTRVVVGVVSCSGWGFVSIFVWAYSRNAGDSGGYSDIAQT